MARLSRAQRQALQREALSRLLPDLSGTITAADDK
jgi:hypothetical protein